MARLLRLLGPRYGMALVLLLILTAVVGVARLTAGSDRAGLFGGSGAGSTHSTASPDRTSDSVSTVESPPPPSTGPGAAAPADVAADFARAWLAHDGVTGDQWRAGLAKYATPALLARLKETDPASVPASRIAGAVSLQSRGTTFVEVAIPLDNGLLQLRLLGPNGRWLVDGLSWERG